MQEVFIGILFLGALVYMGRLFWKQYKAEDGCAAGCHSCDVSSEPKKDLRLPSIKR